MLRIYHLCLAVLLLAASVDVLKIERQHISLNRVSRRATGVSKTKLNVIPSPPSHDSFLISMGDYAAEIEKASVGEEVYAPIFRAGIFLFLSGLVSAAAAAFIISKANSWEALGQEFEDGKKDKLIFSEYEKLNSNTNNGDAITAAMQAKNDDKNNEEIRSASEIDSAIKNLDV